ncbi:MAG: HEAT repeat domain-containing protein, partial [Planctomycetales bacterium]|nr:HEAT repeat domain-containing protein [Planctomycetales bacterium]
FARGAVFGERPGKMPSMLKTGRGAPAGLLLYQQEQFPEFFRGLLIYPDCYRMKVRAYAIERIGSTFAVTQQFTLMEADDGMFRPVQALAGPDGAIYILDWRTDSGGAGKSWGDSQHGRIYRLSWSGTAEYPAIPLTSMDSWSQLASKSPDALFALIKTSGDAELRNRAQAELLQRGNSFAKEWLALANDVSASVAARALAIGAASTYFDTQTQAAMTQLLAHDNNEDVRRLAAEALNRHGVLDQKTVDVLLNSARSDAHPAVRRATALAAGRMAERSIPDVAQGELIRTVATHLLTTLASTDRQDVYLFDGILRAIEYCGAAGMEPLVAAIQSGDQQQIDFSIGLFEALRTRPAADALDRILSDHADALTTAQLQRILETYRHILLHPTVDSSGILAWLQQHPDAADSLQVTALQTLGMLGGGQATGVADLALRLLQSDDGDIQLDTIHAIGELRIMAAVRPLVDVIADGNRRDEVRSAAVQSLGMLRAEAWPFLDRQDQGVELVVDDLVRLCKATTGSLQADILSLVSQVKIESAVPLAQQLLQSDDAQTVAAAIDVLGTRRDQAIQVAQRYLAGEMDSQQLARVASGLQRHVPNDANGEISNLIARLYQDGLKISNEPSEVERIKDLVRRTGNAERGKLVFLAKEKSQCAKCHQLEGVGGQIGPDLSGIWQTHTIEKLIESVAVPSKEIKEGFATWNATTGSGQVYSGLKLSEDNREVVLRDANGRDIRINKNEIEELDPSQTSLMPDGTVAQLTLTEFVDLLAFLKDGRSQKSLASETQD